MTKPQSKIIRELLANPGKLICRRFIGSQCASAKIITPGDMGTDGDSEFNPFIAGKLIRLGLIEVTKSLPSQSFGRLQSRYEYLELTKAGRQIEP